MFEDEDEDYLEVSEKEDWYDLNRSFFHLYDKDGDMPLDVELFYDTVYIPLMKELENPVRELVYRQYPFIATETRPEVLEELSLMIKEVGRHFLLSLHDMMLWQKYGKDLREIYPKLDKWAVQYPALRKPKKIDLSYIDKRFWMTADERQKEKEEEEKALTEIYACKEQWRFDFFELLQNLTFKYYPSVQEINSDGWTMYDVFLHDEYTIYQSTFEFYDDFIDYGFDVEDLKLPTEEYDKKYAEKYKERRNEEIRKKLEEENEAGRKI